ncbi:ankyrin repeat domain-containing protein [Pseudomonas sp. RIT-PI-AD]|uniref:ankyrin repeat domain-containing protein n=1 Tax=Pseudomonas sp. RIT-PI-AD TaxID=3035294 RepID=UPI0021D997A8|nr:ankyrin repeat domain-containing protein [Pseudomonas sp. RIT-PI-AD]
MGRLIGYLGVFAAALLALLIGVLSQMSLEDLLVCTLEDSGIPLPPPLCYQYVMHFRTGPADAQELQAGGGVDFVLNLPIAERYALAAKFIENGLDVNAESRSSFRNYRFRPLHAAAMQNEAERIDFLLRHGADKNRQDSRGQTALQLAERQQQEHPEANYAAVIERLR